MVYRSTGLPHGALNTLAYITPHNRRNCYIVQSDVSSFAIIGTELKVGFDLLMESDRRRNGISTPYLHIITYYLACNENEIVKILPA